MIGAILFVVFAVLLYVSTRKPAKFPPGPPRLPVIGHRVKVNNLYFNLHHLYRSLTFEEKSLQDIVPVSGIIETTENERIFFSFLFPISKKAHAGFLVVIFTNKHKI